MHSDFIENMFTVAYTLAHWDACDRDSRCRLLRPPRPLPRPPARPCHPPPLSACSSRTAAVPPAHCRPPPDRLSAAPPALQSRQPCPAVSPPGGIRRGTTWTGDSKCRKEVKTGFCRKRSMQTGSSESLIGWKFEKTTNVPLWRERGDGLRHKRSPSTRAKPNQTHVAEITLWYLLLEVFLRISRLHCCCDMKDHTPPAKISNMVLKCCSQIHSPWMGDIVDSGMQGCHTGLPASLCSLAGRVRQPYAGVNIIPPVRDYEFRYTGENAFSCSRLQTYSGITAAF